MSQCRKHQKLYMVDSNILELGNKKKQKKITEEQNGRSQFQFKEKKIK